MQKQLRSKKFRRSSVGGGLGVGRPFHVLILGVDPGSGVGFSTYVLK